MEKAHCTRYCENIDLVQEMQMQICVILHSLHVWLFH
jgi:hypothetical protein